MIKENYMTYKELMAKLAKSEPLTAEEYQEFEKLTRPAERFNEISNKKNELESQLKAKDDEIAQLKAEVTDAKQRVDDELNTRLGELSGKNETLASELAELRITNQRNETLLKVNELSRKNELGVVFKNPDYLAYRAEKDGVDLNDSEKVKAFLTGIKDNEPEMCAVPVKGGAGTGSGDSSDATKATKPVKDWSDKDKADYITEHGYDAYQSLKQSESK
jgi:flagellar biosynthesis/type III secretory pathway chaperone